MKQPKLVLIFTFILLLCGSVVAQNKTQIPQELQGFWHFEVQNKGDWDGARVGETYVEFFYKIYQVTEVVEGTDHSYQITLKPEEGNTISLSIEGFDGKTAQLKFSGWTETKSCSLLEYPVDTEPVAFSDMPAPLFKKWTKGDGVVTFQLHGNNKLFFNNEDWDVVSIGHYLDKEYRILVKNDEIHKFVYVLNYSDKNLLVASNLKNVGYVPLASNPDIYRILGNWAEKNSNQWRLGFFEETAIFNGEFYTYKSLEFDDSSCEIVLENQGKTIHLDLDLTAKDLCQVKIDGEKEQTYFKCEKHLPAYATADHTKFLDTGFLKVDTVTIRGLLRNNSVDKPFSVSIRDPLTQEQVEFYADVDERGIFTLKFPLMNTTQVYLDWGRMTKVAVMEPGERCLLFYDFSTQQHLVMGDNERFHNEVAAYEVFHPNKGMSREDYAKMSNMKPMPFLEVKKEELQKSYDHLQNYLEENPTQSEKFKYYHQENYRFQIAFYIMQKRFSLDRNEREQFPEGYMEYVSDTLYQNEPVKPYTLARDYLLFMRDYMGYKHEISGKASHSVSSIDGLRYLEKEGRLKLSEQENQAIAKSKEFYEILGKLRMENADSATIAEASKPYEDASLKLNELFQREEVKNFMKNEWGEITSLLFDKMRLEADLAHLDREVKDPLLKDLFETQKFYWLLDYRKTSLPADLYETFQQRVQNPVFAARVDEPNNYYRELITQDIYYIESLKNTDHLKEAKDADSLLASLIEPYRGKVIYVDFWGTWCGPCKGQMQYVKFVKEDLKDKDVIFMYFANNSPEASWKNIIRENQLTGENAVHYRLPREQQAMIERRLSVRSFPTYMLIDKEGNIVNMSAPRPQDKKALVSAVTNLLNQ
ncbi:TlpA family protein disulfide reductase [Sunxiuqinia dokdonensis]|uniref:Thioredoxin domain-containing protein n=1 Tax=Sunxiuqinia dokdonensis TaxID=1409788 RepID=A0A0L8VCE4_9BACT|nr:TlpA disulfide reductase family protein [Sunxiuqinia dokdonensis]KOH46124.1 hypothetical protein NC99_10360 [Sunxiuqinia dokdonensis]